MQTSDGHMLGGRVRYTQPQSGFRSGLEPVLLAAAIPARPGERVLEAGTGAGAALLCLTARVPGLACVGVEIDPALAAIARSNVAQNAVGDTIVITGDIAAFADKRPFDHAFANPPYHRAGSSIPPDPERARAKHATQGGFDLWAQALGRCLRTRGTLTLVVPAAALTEAMAALTGASCTPSLLLPCWPHAGEAAKLVLLRGIKGGRGTLRLAAGLVLHQQAGGFTDAADAILRDGSAWEE